MERNLRGKKHYIYPHNVDRISIDVGQPYEEFKRRYEEAVPPVDFNRIQNLVQRGASWEEVVADTKKSAPFGFLIFFKLDPSPLMKLAGLNSPCTEYLMGNLATAAPMYRNDPSIMVSAPPRTLIYVDKEGLYAFRNRTAKPGFLEIQFRQSGNTRRRYICGQRNSGSAEASRRGCVRAVRSEVTFSKGLITLYEICQVLEPTIISSMAPRNIKDRCTPCFSEGSNFPYSP